MRYFLYMVSFIFIVGCNSETNTSRDTSPPVTTEPPVTTKIMPLGDSITWDWHYNDPRTDAERSGYRNYLWYKLQDGGYNVDFVGSRYNGGAVEPHYDGDNEGYTGITCNELEPKVYNLLQMNPPNIILLHIGTNDSLYHPDANVEGLEQILDDIDRFENDSGHKITVILAQIINLQKDPGWISRYNDNLVEMATDRIDNGDDIILVDMMNGADLLYWGDYVDGIHPNNNGYKKMADVWFNALKQVISSQEFQ